MKLIKRLLWMIPLIIKWILIFALWIAAMLGIKAVVTAAVTAAVAFLLSLTPTILFYSIIIVFMVIISICLAWGEAGGHV